MEATDERAGTPADGGRPAVAVHECSPERVVFVEEENTDAWIATDLAVDPPD